MKLLKIILLICTAIFVSLMCVMGVAVILIASEFIARTIHLDNELSKSIIGTVLSAIAIYAIINTSSEKSK